MALVDIAATAEDNLLQAEDEKILIHEDLRYRDRQLLRLRDEVLDLEDFNESMSLNEFTLDDFRMELAAYMESNRARLEEAPFGLYTVVPPHHEYATIKPGVVYCLKQHQDAPGNEAVNALQPYFLVYIRDDGDVRYNFTAPRQTLEILRVLCRGQDAPYRQLCELFDAQTSNGEDMSHYSDLLEKAVDAIVARFARKSTRNLFSGRDGKLIDSGRRVKHTDDFELITWLVIRDGAATNAPD